MIGVSVPVDAAVEARGEAAVELAIEAPVEPPVDLAATWRRWRLPLALGALIVGLAAVIAAVAAAPPQRPLDPRDASPGGARALAELLRARGVTVTPVEPASGVAVPPDVTVMVPDPGSLTLDQLRSLAGSGADLVVGAPSAQELRALGVRARPAGAVSDTVASPECGLAAATAAGDVRIDGVFYAAAAGVPTCYPVEAGAAVVADQGPAGQHVTVLGSTRTLTNEWLGDEGDAALALNLLGTHDEVRWLLPQPPAAAAADRKQRGIASLLPSRLRWALGMLGVVVVLAGLWRARRLGAVVAEPLPVVVRAAETVEGRSRLLRAAGARGTAAASLRSAARDRLTTALGIGTPDPAAVVDGVSRRTRRAPAEVQAVLYGPDPRDDATLIRLAHDLDTLECAVRRADDAPSGGSP